MRDYEMKNHQGKEGKKAPIRAAQYVRRSTEHQKYSTENQRDIDKALVITLNMCSVASMIKGRF